MLESQKPEEPQGCNPLARFAGRLRLPGGNSRVKTEAIQDGSPLIVVEGPSVGARLKEEDPLASFRDEQGSKIPSPRERVESLPARILRVTGKTVASPAVLAGTGTTIYTLQDGAFVLLYGALTLASAVNVVRGELKGAARLVTDEEGESPHAPASGIRGLAQEVSRSEALFPLAQGLINIGVATQSLLGGDGLRGFIFTAMAVGSFGVAAAVHEPLRNRVKSSFEGIVQRVWDAVPSKARTVLRTPGFAYGVANLVSTVAYTNVQNVFSTSPVAGVGFAVSLIGMGIASLIALKPVFSSNQDESTLSTKIAGVSQGFAGVFGFAGGVSPVAIANTLWGVSVALAGFRRDRQNRDEAN